MKIKIKKINSNIRNGVRSGVLAVFMIGTFGFTAASETQLDSSHHSTEATIQSTEYTPFQYVWYAGSTFIPFNSTAKYGYKGEGCIYSTAADEKRFIHKVLLPEGAVIDYMRMYSYDDSTSSITGFLTTYDAAGSFDELFSMSSENGGYGSVLSPLVSYTVDTFSSAMNVVINLGNTVNSNLAFCGVRIAYKLPIDDLIFKNGFE